MMAEVQPIQTTAPVHEEPIHDEVRFAPPAQTADESSESKNNEPSESNGTNGQVAPIVKVEEPENENEVFSWLKPHPIFVILLVGPNEDPFGIQKDVLCAHSEYFKEFFRAQQEVRNIENVVKLKTHTPEVFGLCQNFIYTGSVGEKGGPLPSFEALVGLWKLGLKLGISGMFDAIIATMKQVRAATQRIPSTPLLVSVWKETPEGSAIQKLLLTWAAEYMRSSDARSEFAKSLPQEVLSELVVLMSSFDEAPMEAAPTPTDMPAPPPRKNVHYLEGAEDEPTLNSLKRSRRVSGGVGGSPSQAQGLPGRNKAVPKPAKRKTNSQIVGDRNYTTPQKLEFCGDLLTRMLSGPGFWTRLVGPFKEPVVPSADGVPDYFDFVKRPMDLSTIKRKMDRREYSNEEDFLADMRQIFENCFAYWKKGSQMHAAGEKLQKTFEEKFLGMNKWIGKMGVVEGE